MSLAAWIGVAGALVFVTVTISTMYFLSILFSRTTDVVTIEKLTDDGTVIVISGSKEPIPLPSVSEATPALTDSADPADATPHTPHAA